MKRYLDEAVNEFMKKFKTFKTKYEAYQINVKNQDGDNEMKKDSVIKKLEKKSD